MVNILPREFAQTLKTFGGHVAGDSGIYTNIPTGTGIFRELSPYVGNRVYLDSDSAHARCRSTTSPTPANVLVIVVKRPANPLTQVVFQNKAGGDVTATYADGAIEAHLPRRQARAGHRALRRHLLHGRRRDQHQPLRRHYRLHRARDHVQAAGRRGRRAARRLSDRAGVPQRAVRGGGRLHGPGRRPHRAEVHDGPGGDAAAVFRLLQPGLGPAGRQALVAGGDPARRRRPLAPDAAAHSGNQPFALRGRHRAFAWSATTRWTTPGAPSASPWPRRTTEARRGRWRRPAGRTSSAAS